MLKMRLLILTLAVISPLLTATAYAQDDDILDYLPAIINAAKQKPPEPPPPEPEDVTILPTDSCYVNSINYLNIIGEIHNNTANYITFARVSVNVFNGDQLVDTDFSYTFLSIIPPHDKACFSLIMPNPANWTSYQFEAPQYQITEEVPPQLTPYSLSGAYNDTFGWYEIIGLVRNDSDRLVQFVSPIATLYDANGMARACDFTYVNSTDLDLGQSSSFDMLSTGRDFGDITSYRIQVDGD